MAARAGTGSGARIVPGATGERAVGIARDWIGTPYRHQASVRGAGCDCLGLLRGIWREIHGAEPAEIPPYTPDWDEPQGREVLARAAAELFLPLGADAPWRPGQVLLFRMKAGGVAKHLGLLSEPGVPRAETIPDGTIPDGTITQGSGLDGRSLAGRGTARRGAAGAASGRPEKAPSAPRKGARFIHAYARHGVIESPLSLPWQRRIAGRFDWPERAD